MSNDMSKALNTQINHELYSAYLYLGMAAYFKMNNLPGFGKWLEFHAQEELTHAMKMYNFIIDRSWHVNLLPIQAAKTTWKSPEDALTAAYEHEKQVTSMINHLVTMAINTNDHASNIFLQWFVTEQVEEELVFSEILGKIKLAGDFSAAMLFLDTELEKKAQPTTTAAGKN